MKYNDSLLLHHVKYLEIDGCDEIELISRISHSKIHSGVYKKIPKHIVSISFNRLKRLLKGINYSDIYGGFCLINTSCAIYGRVCLVDISKYKPIVYIHGDNSKISNVIATGIWAKGSVQKSSNGNNLIKRK